MIKKAVLITGIWAQELGLHLINKKDNYLK